MTDPFVQLCQEHSRQVAADLFRVAPLDWPIVLQAAFQNLVLKMAAMPFDEEKAFADTPPVVPESDDIFRVKE